MMHQIKSTGKVILAGAGPGDADLITLKLQKALAIADIIITDRLVNPAIIENNAKSGAIIVLAGKQGYNDASASQEWINETMVRYAREGKTVLRLKGGDIAFYSKVMDELQALRANQVAFEMIPGITAAAGAAAFAGIPLTARGFAQGVQFHSYNPNNIYGPEKWKCLAASGDTLVFYMAVHNVQLLAELLLRYSRKPSTPLAVIEQATTCHQQVHVTSLKDCGLDFAGKSFSSPSLVIVGEVVNLHDAFNWFIPVEKRGSIFNELVNH
jgi:uroporphyrin-III C-methyltransferase